MEKIKKIFIYVMLILIGLFISISTLENGILLSILSIVVIYLFVKKVNIKRFSLFLIIFCLVTKIVAILLLNNQILADYYIMYDASEKVLFKDLSFVNKFYFTQWGYQLFHVFYQALMLKFINNIIFLKILNCIYSTVITVVIYNIVKKISSEKSARIVSLLYAISLYPLYLNGILGNQQLAMMLMLIAIYIFLFKKRNIVNLLLVGFLMGVSNLERPEGIVYILTIIVYIIFTNKKFKEILKNVMLILIMYLIVTNGASLAMIKFNINEIGFRNSNPQWKFLIGFNYKYDGKNNIEDEIYLTDTKKENEEIIRRITDFKKLPNLFYQKIKIQWLYDDLDNTFNVKNNKQFSKSIIDLILNYAKIINLVIIIFIFIGLFKNKKINNVYYFFLINIFIYFGIYLLIEVAARYYFNPQVSIIILSSLGIERLISTLEKNNFKKNKKIISN